MKWAALTICTLFFLKGKKLISFITSTHTRLRAQNLGPGGRGANMLFVTILGFKIQNKKHIKNSRNTRADPN